VYAQVLHAGLVVVFAIAAVMASLTTDALAHAEPGSGDAPTDPYPDLRYFTQIDAEPYTLPDGQGVWFLTAQGLNCGIWFRGSFGCAGDIPGAPAGTQHIGWLAGDTRVHYDWTVPVRFPQSRGSLAIPPLSYVESQGTSCATRVDGATYCERGPWRLLITADHTWLNG
jgi:hypothetical protein